MADFDELLALGANPGDEGLPETFWDDLAGVHNDAVTTRDAAYAEKDAAHTELAATLQRVQAHNYELMLAVNGKPAEEPESDSEDSTESTDTGPEGDSIWEVK